MSEHAHTRENPTDNLELIGKLGTGVFGEVYHVREHQPPYKEYALKKIFNNEDANKIKNEIQALELLSKHNIGLKLYSMKKTAEGVALLLEYSPGKNLKKHVRRNGPLSEVEMTKLLSDMISMLQFMQKNELLHLDIKPTNILLHNNTYILIDWGLSTWGSQARTIRLNGNAIYFPPEIYYGVRNIASEIYSLGCVLYFALTGKEIFGLNYHKPLCQKIYSHIFLHPEFPEKVSNKFQYLVTRMIEKQPEKRITIPEIENILHENKTYELKRFPPGTPVDFSDEFNVFKILADNNVPYAQNILARYYLRGENVAKDYRMAFNLNNLAVEYNIAKAQFDLGVAYRDGKGVEGDKRRAFEMFFKAAKQGHEQAQYVIARMYDKGTGVQQDKRKAQHWYEQAALNGHKKSKSKLSSDART